MPAAFQFSDFVLDPRQFELRRGERILKLEKIPMELLILLVEREGELVTRGEIVEKVWGKDIFLEADRGINTAISKLRVVLQDNPERPRYIQTVVGKGYRFIAAISQVQSPEASPGQGRDRATTVEAVPSPAPAQRFVRGRLGIAVVSSSLLLALLAVSYYVLRNKAVQSPQSLAVLPFKPLSNGDRDEYLELGMADALITKLSRPGRLIVRPTSAIRKYTGADSDTLAAGRALQVDAVLEGNIQRVGDRLRVSSRLLRVSDGASLWSDSYDAKFTDVFQVQDSVSERVGDALALQLSSLEKASLRKRDTANVQAYELYMRGIFFWNKRNEEGLRKAVSYFEQAIALDDNYALAHAGLAAALSPMGYRGYSAPEEINQKMRAAATRAVTLDPTLPEAHVALGAVLAFYEWNWSEGEKEFQRALELNPNLPLAHHWYGQLLDGLGRYDEALQHRQRAQELDPITPIIVFALGQTQFLLGDNERALAQFRKTLELDNSFDYAHIGIGQVYEQRGEYERAIPEYRLAVQYSSGSQSAGAALGHALARAGAASEARQILNEWVSSSHTQHVSPVYLAMICVGLGDNETALNWLEKAYDQRDAALSGVLIHPQFQTLHTHPRFRRLLQRMGLAAAQQSERYGFPDRSHAFLKRSRVN
jgi:TolB-like protein/DNA-binding winged helix-turn-helix (wHTH) protein/Tfp pilus assembly protein PilF